MDGLLDRRRQLAEGLLAQGLPPAQETPMDRLINQYRRLWTDTNALQKVGMANVPVVSDVAGLLGDVQQYIQHPEQRTGINYALSGLGLLPFVPAAFGMVKKVGDVPAMSVRDDLGKIADEIKSARGLQRLDLYPKNDGSIEVAAIEVPKDLRKQGIGTKAMQDVIAYADQQGKRLVLTPALKDERHGTTSRSRLVDFYKRLGFVENKGRNKDFAISDGMYREPKNSGLAQSIPDELPAWAPAERMAQWRTARANAALPVEQGGLGLGPENTAAERSGAMGFNVDAYHGTGADIDAFDITKMYSGEGGSHGGSGFYLAETPQNASAYGLLAAEKGAAGNVMPLRAKIDNPMPIDWERGEVTGAKELSKKEVRKIIMDAPNIKSTEDSPLLNWGDFGYEGFQKILNDAVKGYAGTGNLAALRNDFFGDDHAAWLKALSNATGHDSAVQVTGKNVKNYVVWNPANIRSRFAAFDPKRRNEADLLASWLLPLMAGGGLLGGYYAQPQAD
jgi:GNAT superfamily N-acetyltransferase